MCKDNTIITSWSWLGAIVGIPIIFGGIVATMFGADLTWGEIMITPFILFFFLKKQCCSFSDSGFTVQWFLFKHTVSADKIKQIDFFETKSGTWIVIELVGAPPVDPMASRSAIISYYLRHLRKCYLLQLQFGERDKAFALLHECFPHKYMRTL